MRETWFVLRVVVEGRIHPNGEHLHVLFNIKQDSIISYRLPDGPYGTATSKHRVSVYSSVPKRPRHAQWWCVWIYLAPCMYTHAAIIIETSPGLCRPLHCVLELVLCKRNENK
jgi:hypothetical protein